MIVRLLSWLDDVTGLICAKQKFVCPDPGHVADRRHFRTANRQKNCKRVPEGHESNCGVMLNRHVTASILAASVGGFDGSPGYFSDHRRRNYRNVRYCSI